MSSSGEFKPKIIKDQIQNLRLSVKPNISKYWLYVNWKISSYCWKNCEIDEIYKKLFYVTMYQGYLFFKVDMYQLLDFY